MPGKPQEEMRRDPIRGHWTIIAPGRNARPVLMQDVGTPNQSPAAQPDRSARGETAADDDPFLFGNESETPAERFAIRDDDGRWTVRVVPNRYPALHEDVREANTPADPFRSRPAHGQHEVIVECPHFEQQLANLSVSQIADVLTAWQARLRTVEEASRYDYALIFKNSGQRAGASIPHSHSQLTATVQIPDAIQSELRTAQAFFAAHDVALQDYVVERECQADRAVRQSDGLIAFCPYASRFGCETWIAPVGAALSFNKLSADSLTQLADMLRSVLTAVLAEHPHAPYNLLLHTSPFACSQQPWFRWRLEICPRLAGLAGFELATGWYINTLPPELEAQKLRERLGADSQ